jgi:Transglycosylase SLT domain
VKGSPQECPAPRGSFRTGMLRSRLVLLAALALPCAAPGIARAELIVFEDGRVVKAAGYRLLSEEIEVELPGGGSYRVALERVDRIVDDEVVVDSVAVEGNLATSLRAYDLSYRPGRRPLFTSDYDSLIDAAAKKSNIDPSFVSALIRAESNFEPRAVSRKGARGLMQLMPATARRLSVRRPFDPASNVDGGVRYLRELVDRFGNQPELVLAAYNAGEQAVETYGGVPPYRETVAYVNRILGWLQPADAASDSEMRGPGSPASSSKLEARNEK